MLLIVGGLIYSRSWGCWWGCSGLRPQALETLLLQLRGSGRKLWKRFFCFLRRSGLYYSTKGTSKVSS
jgi:hypothetical protein